MASLDPISSDCKVLNRLLASHEHCVELQRRGNRLVVWARLPSQDGNGNGRLTRQRISLGLPATERGLRDAMEEALTLQKRLETGTFQWRDYVMNHWNKDTIEKSLDRFKEEFFNEPKKRANPKRTKATWEGAYLIYINRLKLLQEKENLPLDVELFQKVLESYEPNSAARIKCSTCLKRLAKQEKIVLPEDWSKLTQGYQSLREGNLIYPSDDEIVELRNKISDPKWRWVFSMMATYGIRTHEVFFCEFVESNEHNAIEIDNVTKTGKRSAYPLRPEWVDIFDLKNVQRPKIKLDRKMSSISSAVSRKFKECSLGIIPYSLRHAWAIRSIHYGLNPSIAAKSMGHTVNIHTSTYLFYLDGRETDKAFAAIKV